MRNSPYPVPPSIPWAAAMAAGYAILVIAGALVLALLIIVPQGIEGILVLGLWGGTVLPSSIVCLIGVLRARYRYEWVGVWGIVMGTSVYLVVTIMGTIGLGLMPFLMSLPTILFFVYAVTVTLARAIQLSIIDYRARRQVLLEKAVSGRSPGVAGID